MAVMDMSAIRGVSGIGNANDGLQSRGGGTSKVGSCGVMLANGGGAANPAGVRGAITGAPL
jgi:hypothetical protein